MCRVVYSAVLELFTQSDAMRQLMFWFYLGCRRKKDHGRAEALLLAAWGIGVRRTTADVAAAKAAEIAELDDTDDCLENVTDVPA